ncbi:hypothetical protein TanjilG_20313 [Lupinus angustifolius]|uniref:Uncharacterized protein n=1 Tax=Lupinus angustifolius TaxID=3871 RepID=A0A1J7HZN7_LUPAN|nr:hypothetical protein TanjilG_20313 [Lupinus angustifolius]
MTSFQPRGGGPRAACGSAPASTSAEEEVIHDRVLSSSLLPFDNEGFLGEIAVLKGFLRSPNARVTISVKKEAIGAIGRMVEARRTSKI